MEKACFYQNSTLTLPMYTIFHLKNSVVCCFSVFANLRTLSQLQCKQVYKTVHKLVLAETSEYLAGNNV